MTRNIAFGHISTTVLLLPTNLKGCSIHPRYPELIPQAHVQTDDYIMLLKHLQRPTGSHASALIACMVSFPSVDVPE